MQAETRETAQPPPLHVPKQIYYYHSCYFTLLIMLLHDVIMLIVVVLSTSEKKKQRGKNYVSKINEMKNTYFGDIAMLVPSADRKVAPVR